MSQFFHSPALGSLPELGTVPPTMLAQVVRESRFGNPIDAFKQETVPTPMPRPWEVLLCVMAAWVNYNNIWAASGKPVNVIRKRMEAGLNEDYHVWGSDASWIVWALWEGVTSVSVGDEVVVHCRQLDADDPYVLAGGDPSFAPSQRIWGYESNHGSFAQFAIVQAQQCLPKPKRLSWAEAASYMLVGATAYRMLRWWNGNVVRNGDPVLVWWGAGWLGSLAIQLVKQAGWLPVAVVSDTDKAAYCRSIWAVWAIDRKKFGHWWKLPDPNDSETFSKWLSSVKSFREAFWEALGERRDPAIVFEHPWASTVPTSCFVCAPGWMVVICAGTTGYSATLDLRYHWMRQKRFQGSHFANLEECEALNDLVASGEISPCLSKTFPFSETWLAHQAMLENRHPYGNMAILVNAPDERCWKTD